MRYVGGEKVICMNNMFAVFGMGGGEIMFVMAAALILFGANKIPQFAKGLGQAIKEFKKASSDVHNELNNAMNQEPPPSPPPVKPQPVAELAAPASTVPKS
jgi:sec-independent protein translocase protein TatA